MGTARIAIIGGGPGGLMTAHLLNQRAKGACQITIFEASHQLGGKIRTGRFNTAPILYEAGAAELYDYSGLGTDPLAEMVKEFGLKRREMTGRTVIMNDRLLRDEADIRRELGPATVAALKAFTRRAKRAISPAEYYESDWVADNEDALAKQSFAELLASVPDEAARNYISVAVHSDLATEPHHTNAMYGLQNYLMNEPGYMSLYSIDGGIEQIIHELVKRVHANVQLGCRVERVERSSTDQYKISYRQHHQQGSEEFDFVVAALPNNWIPSISWGGEKSGEKLSRAMLNHHEHYDHPAHYLRVSVLFEKPFWRDHICESYFMSDAFGGCCVYDETSRVDGCSYGVLGWLLAGEAALTMANLDEAELIDAVISSLPKQLGDGRKFFLEGKVHRWAGAVNGLPAGFPAREPDARHVPEPEDHPDLFVVGDYLFDSTLNGVMDSADTVAEWITEELMEEVGEITSEAVATHDMGSHDMGSHDMGSHERGSHSQAVRDVAMDVEATLESNAMLLNDSDASLVGGIMGMM
jgi:monoamine oxidase